MSKVSATVGDKVRQISGRFVCEVTAVSEGSAIKVDLSDLVLAVFNIDGNIYVIDDACTHGPGSLSEGYIEGHTVVCNFHNGAFDIRTGEVKASPCPRPVRTYIVTICDGKVFIQPDCAAEAVT